MQKIGHKFKYYKNTDHGSFSDLAYLNVKTHLSPDANWYKGSLDERMKFFENVRKDIREFLEEKIGKYSDFDEKKRKIGGKIHFEEQSGNNCLGTIEINKITRETLKECFNIKNDTCADNAKALIIKENDDFIIKHYEEKSKPGIGEEMHATLLYTSKRVDNGHEILKDVFENLKEVDNNLINVQVPTVNQIAEAYSKIIKPSWEFEISDIKYVMGKTGNCVVAELLFEGKKEIQNKNGKPISGDFLHMTLVNVDFSILTETVKINDVVLKLKQELLGKKIKIGNRKGVADLEFGISGSKERIRPCF
jgi:hypothetical protein